LIGERIGKLLIIEEAEPVFSGKQKYRTYLCSCDCGNKKIIRKVHLQRQSTKSCGCTVKENAVLRNTSHGFSNSLLWEVWKGMNSRCNNPANQSYRHYGGKGVQVSERWKQRFDGVEIGFMNFSNDVLSTYREGLEIERIDNNKNYEPSNCTWASRKDQILNRSITRFLEFQGKILCLSDWAELLGINKNTLFSRIDVLGWSVEKAFTTPARKVNK
jgi:hypothetical protein